MNTSKSKPLAKVFGPVLLLSAALALPVDSYAAPSPRERNAQSDRADRNERKANRAERQKRNEKQEVRQDRQRNQARDNQGQERRAAAQREAELNRQRAAERQAAVQRKADVNRQKAAERRAAAQRAEARQAELQRKAESQRLKQQYEQSRRERQLRESRQAEVNRRAQLQRQAELNRRAELQRRADLQRRTELQRRGSTPRYTPLGRFYDRSNNRYQNYAGGRSWNRGDTIAVDGHLTNEGYRCQALRDDNGDLYMLVGNTYGLRTGDHARVIGRVVDGGHCDWEGIAFEVTDVTALWADRRHQAVYYHQNYDGGRFGHRDTWMGRRPRQFQNRVEQRYGYYDRDTNRYDDRYRDDRYHDDRSGNRQLIIREGRVANNRGCPVLVSGNDQFGLTGNLGNLRNGDNVKVTGFLEGPSRCAGQTIRVGEIAGR